MLRLIRLERRIARLEARRAARRRDRDARALAAADAEDPREVIIRRLNRIARMREADAFAPTWQRGSDANWYLVSPGAAAEPEPAEAAGESPPDPIFPNAAAVRAARLSAGPAQIGGWAAPGDGGPAGEPPRPPPARPPRLPARPCEAPGAVPCGLFCRLGGRVDCRALARRGFALTAPPPPEPGALAAGGGAMSPPGASLR